MPVRQCRSHRMSGQRKNNAAHGSGSFENILQKIHYERQYSYRDGEAAWQDYTSILYQGAADSADVIERFRYYQDGKMMHVREIEAYGQGMRELLWDELQLTELLVHLDAGTCWMMTATSCMWT